MDVEEFHLSTLAGRAMVSGMTAGFQNAKDHFLTGKQTFCCTQLAVEEAQREVSQQRHCCAEAGAWTLRSTGHLLS